MSWVKEADLPDLPEIFKAISSNGQALELVERLNAGIAFGSSALTRPQEEAIATAVSVANRCRYGALTHGGFFRKHADDSDTASQLLADHTQADLSQRDHVMLDFSVKVTLDPAGLTEQDLDGLREAGFTDDQIVSIVLVTCLFNFMNRIANSLGVAVPAPFARSVESWLTGPAEKEAWLLGRDAGQQPGNLTWSGLEKSLEDLSKPRPPPVVGDEVQSTLIDTALPQLMISPPKAPANPETNATPSMEEAALVAEPSADSTPALTPDVSLSGNRAPAEELPVAAAPNGESEAEHVTDEGPAQYARKPDDSAEGPAKGSRADSEEPVADEAPSVTPQLGQFMSECCTVGVGETCSARDVYVAYLRWCDINLSPPALQRNFGLGLSEMGFQRQRRSHGQHCWQGLSINTGATSRRAA